jgi:hypothetical protein
MGKKDEVWWKAENGTMCSVVKLVKAEVGGGKR